MLLQTIISQSNNTEIYDVQPVISWNGALSGDYPTISGIQIKDVFTPATENIDTYNHHIQSAYYYGHIHIIFTTHENAEVGYGSRIRYVKSTDDGDTWSAPVVLLEAQDDSTKDYTDMGLSGRQSVASDFAVYNNELYALVDVNHISPVLIGSSITRIGVGELAIKVNSNGTFGTPVWIEAVDGSTIAPNPLPTFPSYSFDENLRINLRSWLDNGVNNPISYFSVPDTDNLFTRLESPSMSVNLMAEPSVTRLPNNQYLRLWKDSAYSFVVAQTSENGKVWNDAYVSGIPDTSSRTRIHKLNSNEVCLIGNNQTGSRNPMYFALSSDGYTYNSDNLHQIYKAGSVTPEFSGQGKGGGPQHPTKVIEIGNKIIIGFDVLKERVKVAIFDKPTLI